MSKFVAGQRVLYLSASANGAWLNTTVEQARPSGDIQLACKPGHWLSLSEQQQKVRAEAPPPTAGGSLAWSADKAYRLGSKGEEASFGGQSIKDHLLDFTSARLAVDALNAGKVSCPEGFCIVFSESSNAYFLLYREGCQKKATEKLRNLSKGASGSTEKAELGAASANPGPAGQKIRPVEQASEVLAADEPSENNLPPLEVLQDTKADPREAFQELRAWVKEKQRRGPTALAAAGQALSAAHRRSILSFLSRLPARKPIFASTAREVLGLLLELQEWREKAVDEADVQRLLAVSKETAETDKGGPPPLPQPAPGPYPVTAKADERQPYTTPEVGKADRPETKAATADSDAPPPPPPPPVPAFFTATAKFEAPVQPEATSGLLEGMPPAEAFKEGSRHDAGDTFKDLRRWAKRLPVWDLEAAGHELPVGVRSDIFRFLARICERQIYKNQGRELLSMLLPLESWVGGGAANEAELQQSLDQGRGKSGESPKAKACPPVAQPEKATGSSPPQGPRTPADRMAGWLDKVPHGRSASEEQAPWVPAERPKVGRGLRSRVDDCLKGAPPLASGQELVELYRKSGLGGGASLSAQASDERVIRLLLVLAQQRAKDLFVDALREFSGRAKVHLPHLHLDLQRRQVFELPGHIQGAVERKIRSLEKWTSMEKAYVLGARHEQTIRYAIAYALARAKATGRSDAVWMSLGMDTGAQGHANALCCQSMDGKGATKVFLYDPNYAKDQEHWVHAKKAVNDALPGVRKLLEGTGISVVGQAELFGHGLQTALGTTTRHQGWFSSTVYTRHEGYPICGGVVYLLAVVWMSVGVGSALSDLVEVEAALADVVHEPAGKALVQAKVAALLKDLIRWHAPDGRAPFEVSMCSRFNGDKQEWPQEVVTNGGHIKLTFASQAPYTYKW
eukprot:TRINITY_DN74026_c0_g1_i1.p1 TRINITY_DN74026_c0_g1~~TRINITY_DN74026_c0_g1_i1.p1  ORF type:complete len:911 (-),score=178.86 TRINITY_DN74026_c0_g1_i1:177-2909(-)